MSFPFGTHMESTGNEGKKSAIGAHAYIVAGNDKGATLTHQNSSWKHFGSRIDLDPKILRTRISAVFTLAGCLLMCHIGIMLQPMSIIKNLTERKELRAITEKDWRYSISVVILAFSLVLGLIFLMKGLSSRPDVKIYTDLSV